MTRRPFEHSSRRSLLRTEDLDAQIRLYLEQALADASDLITPLSEDSQAPDISEIAFSNLRAALEDEIVPAKEPDNGSIDLSELDREIAKKALVGLKIPVLRDIARELLLPVSGSIEDLATRVAAAYEWDDAAIGRLILENNEEETLPDRGFQSRIFTFSEKPSLSKARRMLDYVGDRYIRTGVARWFVFGEPAGGEDRIEVAGTLRTYKADVSSTNGEIGISSAGHDTSSSLVIEPRRTFVISDGDASTAKASADALQLALGTDALSYVPFADTTGKATRGGLHPSSEFLLDLLYSRLRNATFSEPNLHAAKFDVGNSLTPSIGEDGSVRPSLRGVSFDGDHIVDSVVASRLLSTEGRALVDMSMTVIVRSKEANSIQGRFPIRVALVRDHVLVSTGYGSGEHEISHDVHRQVVDAVREEIEFGLADAARLEALADRIAARAQSNKIPERADILSDPS